MSYLWKYLDILDNGGHLQHVRADRLEHMAEALAASKVRFSWAIDAQKCGARPLINKVFADIGVHAAELENMGLKFSVDLHTFKPYGEVTSDQFIRETRDLIVRRREFLKAVDYASKAKVDSKFNTRASGIVAATAGAYWIASHAVTTFSWWQNAALIALVGGAAIIVPAPSRGRYARGRMAVEHSASKVVLEHWARTALECGEWKISMESRFSPDDYSPVEQPVGRLEDVKNATPDSIAHLIDFCAAPEIPFFLRGLHIEVSSRDPNLQGSKLTIRAYPDESASFPKPKNPRKKRKEDQSAFWKPAFEGA